MGVCNNCHEPDDTGFGLCAYCTARLCVECEREVLTIAGGVCPKCAEDHHRSMSARDRAMTDLEQWQHDQHFIRIEQVPKRVTLDYDYDDDEFVLRGLDVRGTCPCGASEWSLWTRDIDEHIIECRGCGTEYALVFGVPVEFGGTC